jgi:hypothetical protein
MTSESVRRHFFKVGLGVVEVNRASDSAITPTLGRLGVGAKGGENFGCVRVHVRVSVSDVMTIDDLRWVVNTQIRKSLRPE